MNLNEAWVYDIETFPNVFTLNAEHLHNDVNSTWEISHYRDDRQALLQWFDYLFRTQSPMVGFNNLGFDYIVIHYLFNNPGATVEQIYDYAMQVINAGRGDGNARFGFMVWADKRFAPQIDLFKLHHFDNKAKMTSLKALQVNMRLPSVVDMPVEVGTHLTEYQTNTLLKPYNVHDTKSTKAFAHISMDAIKFRAELVEEFGPDVMNYNDTKIGAKFLENRLDPELLYTRDPRTNRRKPRGTYRSRIALSDIIFPWIGFTDPGLVRVLEYMRSQVLTPEDLNDPEAQVKTKGVFAGLTANVGGIDLHFGTGGVHGSVEKQRIIAGNGYIIRDIDVAGMYPAISNAYQLAPEHLGQAFTIEYGKLPEERAKYPKGTTRNGIYKLAGNGTYGNTNNIYSPFCDPQMTMTITINGQLMIALLAQELAKVPTIKIIQVNTDGLTYYIDERHEPQAASVCRWWEGLTRLVLEDADYSRMFIRDVNSYVAESTEGKLKQKGAHWHPKQGKDYADSISNAGPPAWHKDLSMIVSTRAAVQYMVNDIDPEAYIKTCFDPYDFMIRAKVGRADKLLLGGIEQQRVGRYYVSKAGQQLCKVSPARGPVGQFKRANKIPDATFNAVMAEIGPGVWDGRIHTKNQSVYEDVVTNLQSGWRVKMCNDVNDFDFNDVDFDFYINEAKKLIV